MTKKQIKKSKVHREGATELPGMPEKSELQNHCERFLEQHDKSETAKSNMELIGDEILLALRTEKRDSVIIEAPDGFKWKFSVSQSKAKIKAKKL